MIDLPIVMACLVFALYVALSFPAMKYIARELPSVLEDPDFTLFMTWPVGLFLVRPPKLRFLGNAWHSVYCKIYPDETESKEESG